MPCGVTYPGTTEFSRVLLVVLKVGSPILKPTCQIQFIFSTKLCGCGHLTEFINWSIGMYMGNNGRLNPNFGLCCSSFSVYVVMLVHKRHFFGLWKWPENITLLGLVLAHFTDLKTISGYNASLQGINTSLQSPELLTLCFSEPNLYYHFGFNCFLLLFFLRMYYKTADV